MGGGGIHTFLNFLFHSWPAMRTFTALSMRPAETTTPTWELEKSLRTMGLPAMDLDIVIGVRCVDCRACEGSADERSEGSCDAQRQQANASREGVGKSGRWGVGVQWAIDYVSMDGVCVDARSLRKK